MTLEAYQLRLLRTTRHENSAFDVCIVLHAITNDAHVRFYL